MRTVGQPEAIGVAFAVTSPIRAAGLPPMSTVGEPPTMGVTCVCITPPAPVTMSICEVAMSPVREAGLPQMRTVGAPGGRIDPVLVSSPARAAGLAAADATKEHKVTAVLMSASVRARANACVAGFN